MRPAWHRAAFDWLLRLYPRWFRDAYAEEMTLLFATRLERTAGAWNRMRLWMRAVGDAVTNAVAVRREDRPKEALMETLGQDIRHAARRLVRSPGFTLGAIAILAIGMGANTTIFTVVDALLFRPPPWTDADRVVHVYQDSDEGFPSTSSFPATRDMAEYDVFSDVAAAAPSFATWDGPDGLVPVATEYATSSYLRVFGLEVQRGRWFDAEEDVVGAAPAAVVSDATWRTKMASDPNVIGRTIQLNGFPVTIVGVGPEGLTSTATPLRTDFWLSIASAVVNGPFQVANLERREDHWYQVRARLAPGVSVPQAQAAMDALARRHEELYPAIDRGRGITVFASSDVRVHPLQDGDLFAMGGLLAGVALTVLILACANLANLLLVRGLDRSGEMAVRSALGAPRGRVARLFLIESVLLTVVGGFAGLLLTRWALTALPGLPFAALFGSALDVRMDARGTAFALGLVLVTGVLFGLAPAVRSARTDVGRALRDDRRGRGSLRLRNTLVGIQVAASLVLVLAAGLIARSLSALQSVDTGLDVDRIAYLSLDWSRAGIAPEASLAALDELAERIGALPGVDGVAFATRLPAQRQGSTTTEVEGYTPPAGTSAVELPFAVVTDAWFETMGVSMIAGRVFGPEDVPNPAGVAIVINETAARRYWGSPEAALGMHMRGQGATTWTRTVVGVMADTPVLALGEEPTPLFLFSARQRLGTPSYLVVSGVIEPESLLGPMRAELASWRSSVTVNGQGTLVSFLGDGLALPRFSARAMGAFSVLALLLAGLGIYAIVSFSVAKRSAELGIRIALGAERWRVVRMVVREVAAVVAIGLVVGVALASLAASRLGAVLYGVDAFDPPTFVGAIVLLLAVSWAAAYVPARRAAQADPVQALRG